MSSCLLDSIAAICRDSFGTFKPMEHLTDHKHKKNGYLLLPGLVAYFFLYMLQSIEDLNDFIFLSVSGAR